MFGLRKELKLLKNRVAELEEKEAYQIKECTLKSNYSISVMESLNRIIKYSKEGEPTYHLKNKLHASEILLYIDKEEYSFSFDELYGYQSKEVYIDNLSLRDGLAYLTVTVSLGRHMNNNHKTFRFIIDYKHNKYITDQVTEDKKTYNIDDVELPCT